MSQKGWKGERNDRDKNDINKQKQERSDEIIVCNRSRLSLAYLDHLNLKIPDGDGSVTWELIKHFISN